ncbi:MAG: hypothetical protein AAGA75_26630, partial [Cyanobacteria bacterium P01_E01_bin.6]
MLAILNSSNSQFGFSSHFEVKSVRREAILEQQNGLRIQTENCCYLELPTSLARILRQDSRASHPR